MPPRTLNSGNGHSFALRPRSESEKAQARVPVKAKLPNPLTAASPDRLLPDTLPVKLIVSAIGLVIEIFPANSLPLTVPS